MEHSSIGSLIHIGDAFRNEPGQHNEQLISAARQKIDIECSFRDVYCCNDLSLPPKKGFFFILFLFLFLFGEIILLDGKCQCECAQSDVWRPAIWLLPAGRRNVVEESCEE